MTAKQIRWMRFALGQMVVRYGSSMQRSAYADTRGQDVEFKRHQRAARRQFAAMQRLANALEELAIGGAR